MPSILQNDIIRHLSRMAFASFSVARLSATQGSEELLTTHSTFRGRELNNTKYKYLQNCTVVC